MAITQQFVDTVGAALLEATPLTSADSDSINAIKDKILQFDRELGRAPNESQVISWAIPYEQALLKKKEEAEAEVRKEQERRDARQRNFREFHRPSSEDRAEIVQEMRSRNAAAQEPPVLKPNTTYTEEQVSAMSAEEYKRLVLRGESGLPELNQSKPDRQAEEYYKNKILKSRNKGGSPADKLMRAALRRQIREGLR